MTNLIKMVLQLALGIFCFGNSFIESHIDITALFAHVIGGLLQDSINQGPKLHRTLAFSLRILDVSIREILPIFGAHRATNWYKIMKKDIAIYSWT